MPKPKTVLNPMSYVRLARRTVTNSIAKMHPNSMSFVPPGHFYSPLLDIQSLRKGDTAYGDDGVDYWDNVDLRKDEQRAYYKELLTALPPLSFPNLQTEGYRYYTDNPMFPFSDAYTLSSVIRRVQPRKIVEVGSGFSSAVILDTLDHASVSTQVTFIEPYPNRLKALLQSHDNANSRTLVQPVQQVDVSFFDELEEDDILFIDSSHVAKISSDVAFLVLRVLPRLKRGVIVHFHDIFYPNSYPISWIRQGRAWNESLFLRAFLIGNQDYQMFAFNSFAGFSFPELFEEQLPKFLVNTGGSIWLKKVA